MRCTWVAQTSARTPAYRPSRGRCPCSMRAVCSTGHYRTRPPIHNHMSHHPHRADMPGDSDEEGFLMEDVSQEEQFFMDDFAPQKASVFARIKRFFRPRHKPLQQHPSSDLRNYAIDRLNQKLNQTILVFAVVILFVVGLMFLGRTSESPFQNGKIILSNSTHHFHPTTIMISLDGFHPHYISEQRTPSLHEMLVDEYGPPYMTPSFPSSTFPNHWTLVTGLYPSEHGIVGNTFYDPKLHRQFINTNPDYGLDPDFWRGGEPLWTTAGKQGVKSAIHMWPGSEVPGIGDNGPSFVDKYNGKESFSSKRNRIMSWLDIDDLSKRPQLILAYVPTIDQIGHKKGISGDVLVQGLKDVDAFVGSIKADLRSRNLQDIVNLVVVSDHGMAPTSNDRVLIIDDLVDLAKIEHLDGWPLFGLRPKEEYSVSSVLQEVSSNLAKSPLKDHYNLWQPHDFPREYQFGGDMSDHKFNYRLAPIWLVPDVGYSITTLKDYEKMNNDYHPRGVHGYNNTELLMRAIFLGSGPYFSEKLPANKKVLPFGNTDVYNIVCDSLHIQPSANNGSEQGYSVSSHRTLPKTWSDELSYPNVAFDVDHIIENATYDNLWRSPSSGSTVESDSKSDPESVSTSTSTSLVSTSTSTSLLHKIADGVDSLVSDIEEAMGETVGGLMGMVDFMKGAVGMNEND